jgi:DNA polymerase-3 subunit beta
VAHKATLVNALSRALADRLMLMDLEIGRKGFLGYLKALAGSNAVKVIPANGSASESQTTAKRLKVICGSHTSCISDKAWVKEPSGKGKGKATPLTFAEVRICPSNTVKPNVGSLELAEALNRVLPFTAKDDKRPVLSCVNLEAKEGKLTLVSADGFKLAVVRLDYDEGQGQVLISRDDLRGIANALRKAKRARISFEGEDVSKPSSLILDTELIRYKWTSYAGSYPNWQNIIPTEHNCLAHFDTVEAIKAIRSLKALSASKAYPIDLTIGNGKIVMTNPDVDNKGQVELSADTEGEGFIRIAGDYLADALKACGGMVDFKMSSPASPMLFSTNGYQLVVMPMVTDKAKDYEAKRQAEAKAEEQGQADVVVEAEAVAKAEEQGQADVVAEAEAVVEAEAKPKRKPKRSKVPVTA